MKKNVFVIMGLDYHLPRIRHVINKINKYHKINLLDIAVSNYGVLWKKVKPQHMKWHEQQRKIKFGSVLKEFCQKKGFYYYQPSPDTFNFALNICPSTDELLNLVHIARHFYELGYERVYLLHNDIEFRGNAIIIFEKHMQGKWSFVGTLHYNRTHSVNYERVTKIGSKAANDWCRIGTDFFIFSKEFIFELYRIYGTDRRIWDEVFSKYWSYCADLSLFDLSKNKLLGYDGIVIPELNEIRNCCAWTDELGWR